MTADGEGVVPATTIAGIALASALVPLNSTMIAVALPDIASDFDISTRQASVLVTVYLVAMLVGQPLAGRVVRRVGARRLAIDRDDGVRRLLGGGDGRGLVLAARRAPGAAGRVRVGADPERAGHAPRARPGPQRGRAFGVQGSVIGVGAGLGPVIGGLAVGGVRLARRSSA